ncbi:hypothetical protein B0T17DRAFT_253084 [Bombardia bombarda]|uniref:Uncharacterized protein n=1 Tax=Bombardia bombarda TaxID=252184 RepID=A0AA40C479_9PEZI|nr:hypothetical protein B0T17DRAFT_253084 [Bombardia bombarda]
MRRKRYQGTVDLEKDEGDPTSRPMLSRSCQLPYQPPHSRTHLHHQPQPSHIPASHRFRHCCPSFLSFCQIPSSKMRSQPNRQSGQTVE